MSDDELLYALTDTGQALTAEGWTSALAAQDIADAIGAPVSAVSAVSVLRDPFGVTVRVDIRMAEVAA